jgi:hypothetical protein
MFLRVAMFSKIVFSIAFIVTLFTVKIWATFGYKKINILHYLYKMGKSFKVSFGEMRFFYANTFFFEKIEFTPLCSQAVSGIAFYTKVFPLFENGQKKCPKSKTQNTFVQKAMPFLPLLRIF